LNEYGEIEIVRAPDGRLIKELSLVLNSVGIAHRVVGNQRQRWILVPEARAMEALEELADYRRENVGHRRPEEKLEPYTGAITQALLWVAVLALFHVLAQGRAVELDWKAAGMVDGVAIRAGELWRPFTALTLHSDLLHLVSNLFFGALFVSLLFQMLGPTLTWSAVLFAGAAGNLANALIVGPELRSLGASTAVFAALGALTAVQFSRKRTTTRAKMKRWIPLMAGVLLLGWNGMGSAHVDPWQGVQRDPGDNTDIGAHVAGFVCGCLVGALAHQLQQRVELSNLQRRILPWVAPAVLALAWGLALANA